MTATTNLDVDPGKAALGNPRLIRAIIEEMDGGAITFERFMQLALYHPQFGYYRTPGRIGRQGDFLTSPKIHPMFAWAVGAWCHFVWDQLDRPQPFTVIEPGAADGAFATALLDWADSHEDGFSAAIRYVALEPNARGSDSRVDWATWPIEPVQNGVVIANEFFDALPVRLFQPSERGPVEVLVRWDGEHFVEARGAVVAIDGAPTAARFEVSQQCYPTMRELCRLVHSGALLIFDYGYLQDELWADWRHNGTLMCFYRHMAHENPYIHVGDQDITAHINFSDLQAAAEDEGFATHGPVRQSALLDALGLGQVIESARGDLTEYFARRRAFEQLTDPSGLGRINAIAASRDLPAPPPGFEEVAP